MHKYTVEFRIEGRILIPSDVTEALGLEPCQVRRAVDIAEGKRQRNAMWAYDGGSGDAATKRDWDSLEEGLLFLHEQLSPKRAAIYLNFARFDICWWCGHFQQSFDGGPTFSAQLFQKLADFGAPLVLDNYFSRE